jgi:ATP-dependent exoDNAse (exonuclease V) beta subunit
MMTSADEELDTQGRRAVVEDLTSTLFVEAGAGSGKTTCLIDRFIALVKSGVPADRIAAITFTEKAAAELVDRIRAGLQAEAPDSPECREALHVLDEAAIGTLHSFAQRILTEHPIEAGLPPRFTVTDEIASQVAFDARWDEYVDQLLSDAELESSVRLLLAGGGKLRQLREVAIAFNANWDQVIDRLDSPPPPEPAVAVSDIVARRRNSSATASTAPRLTTTCCAISKAR